MTVSRKAPTYRSRTARLRSQVHFERERLDLCTDAYRNLLAALTGQRYARDLNEQQLEQVLAVTSDMAPRRQYAISDCSDAACLELLS